MIWLSGLLFGASLLTVFEAPMRILWFVAIGVTEWGHYLALVCLGLTLYFWVRERQWSLSMSIALGAALLYSNPLLRAVPLARALPAELTARFGPSSRKDAPLNIVRLFAGLSVPLAKKSSHVYASYEAQDLALDVYAPLPKRKDRLPGVIVVHGGSWQSGDRTEFEPFNHYLAGRGYVVVSVDYRLAPGATAPSQQKDVLDAIRYMKVHAGEHGMDDRKLFLLGRSAGGQIALSAAYGRYDPAIKGVIAFYTPSDLVWGYSKPANPLIMNSKKVIRTYLGGPPTAGSRVYEDASPVYSVNGMTPPTLMIHGERDELVSPIHNEHLSKKLAEFKRPYYYLRLPWATHGCDANLNGPCGQISTYAVERFIEAVGS